MKYKHEAEVKQALGIESWRNLSKEKMVRFAAMMPDMETEVAIKIVEQFPTFKEFARGAIDAMDKAHERTLAANEQSQEHVHEAYRDIRRILERQLDKDNLNFEERKYIIEQIQETGNREFQKDSETKKLLDGALGKVLIGAGAVVALGVAFVGGRVLAESQDPEESSED